MGPLLLPLLLLLLSPRCSLLLFAMEAAAAAAAAAPPAAAAPCPGPCRCDSAEPAGQVRLDCSGLGLTALPSSVAQDAVYLDLSMNNLTDIPAGAFQQLKLLEELHLAGNDLSHLAAGTFLGLEKLRVLMLQNNQLKMFPTEALRDLPSLQSLRLDANHISELPEVGLEELRQLRHLWLDDNALTAIPVTPLSRLPSLLALTLAMNHITAVPERAFANLTSLVVLHLHNNKIQSLDPHCFEGLDNLETLDLNYNLLKEFPSAIQSLGNLKELGIHSNNIEVIPEGAFGSNPLIRIIHLYDNPLRVVGRTTFQHLPELQTLFLRGVSDMNTFPNLTGTTNLESLTLTGSRITRLPGDICQALGQLRVLDLSYNEITELPELHDCRGLEEISFQHNMLADITNQTFWGLSSLRSLDLSENQIESIHKTAFKSLASLTKLDLSSNQLNSLPSSGLQELTELRVAGNQALMLFPVKSEFPKLRTLVAAYAYQCCAFADCADESQDWIGNAGNIQKREAGSQTEAGDPEVDENEDSDVHPSVHCTPEPGAFKPCSSLIGNWLLRLGVWLIFLLAVGANSIVAVTTFCSPGHLSAPRLLIGCLAIANLLLGLHSGAVALTDAATLGSFGQRGAAWEAGGGCRAAGFLAVFGLEAGVLVLALLSAERCAFVRRPAERCVQQTLLRGAAGKPARRAGARVAVAVAAAVAAVAASLPLLGVGGYGASPLCLPFPGGRAATPLAYTASLVLLNSLLFLAMTVGYTRLYCRARREDLSDTQESATTRHAAWLIFANCLLYCPVAFVSFASVLGLGAPASPQAVKSVLLLLLPLPACLNPLLYALFHPRFKHDVLALEERAKQRVRASRLARRPSSGAGSACDDGDGGDRGGGGGVGVGPGDDDDDGAAGDEPRSPMLPPPPPPSERGARTALMLAERGRSTGVTAAGAGAAALGCGAEGGAAAPGGGGGCADAGHRHSDCPSEDDSFVSDNSEQLQECSRSCFSQGRGLPLVSQL